MKKAIRISIISVVSIFTIILILFLIYFFVNKQDVIDREEYGSETAPVSMLIASQGSDFKNTLVSKFLDKYINDSIYILVADCSKLDAEEPDGWSAIVVIHTTQIHGMPKPTETFLKHKRDISNVILLTTSGAGDETPANIKCDAISTASRISVVPKIMDIMGPKVDKLLGQQD